MKNKFHPSGLELQILNVLWGSGPATVREVLGQLSDGKRRAYTTVLSTMQVMERKALLKRAGTVSGAIVYKALIGREQVARPALRDLLANLFAGKPSAVMQHLLEDRMVSDEELDEIRRMLDEHVSAEVQPARKKPSGKKSAK